MHRRALLELLGACGRTWASGFPGLPDPEPGSELRVLERLAGFVRSTPDCFHRSHLAGHVTGSALVVPPGLDRVLLMLHGKLGRWLQLGGHADGHPRVEEVALREAREESGLEDLEFLPWERLLCRDGPLPFDLDVHALPARGAEPEHLHHDVRFLLVARGGLEPRRNAESRELRWVPLAEARRLTSEESMLRQFRKLEALAARLRPS